MDEPPPRTQVTLLLDAAARGDPKASEELLPLVYEDLRRLATAMLTREPRGGAQGGMMTLQPTALVHEAYLRLVVGAGGKDADVSWENRGHFFGAAARAMRRILIDRARHIRATRLPITAGATADDTSSGSAMGTASLPDDADELLALDGALDSLQARSPRQYEVVMLRYFAGLTIEQTGLALGVSAGTVKSEWTFARAWLMREVERCNRIADTAQGENAAGTA